MVEFRDFDSWPQNFSGEPNFINYEISLFDIQAPTNTEQFTDIRLIDSTGWCYADVL